MGLRYLICQRIGVQSRGCPFTGPVTQYLRHSYVNYVSFNGSLQISQLMKNLLLLIYSKLHSKSFDYVYELYSTG